MQMDYECEKGAKRNFEPWRQQGGPEESEEERLDRLEREAAETDAMGALEGKMVDAKREMQIADALDEIRTRNARNERTAGAGDADAATVRDEKDLERERQENEDEELAKKAFITDGGEKVRRLGIEEEKEDEAVLEAKDKELMPPPPTLKRGLKRKKDFSAALGIKKKPALV